MEQVLGHNGDGGGGGPGEGMVGGEGYYVPTDRNSGNASLIGTQTPD